jgi:hypothetical protein
MRGVFEGELYEVEPPDAKGYVSFKLAQPYDRPGLAVAAPGVMPAGAKSGDFVTIEGVLVAAKSKAGNAYQRLSAKVVTLRSAASHGKAATA